jgi:hypothetical protein
MSNKSYKRISVDQMESEVRKAREGGSTVQEVIITKDRIRIIFSSPFPFELPKGERLQ